MLCVARNSMHLYIPRPDMTDKQKEEVQQLRARQRAGEQVEIPRYGWQIVEIDLDKLFKDSETGRLE